MLRNGTYKAQNGETVTVRYTATGYLITYVETGVIKVIPR